MEKNYTNCDITLFWEDKEIEPTAHDNVDVTISENWIFIHSCDGEFIFIREDIDSIKINTHEEYIDEDT